MGTFFIITIWAFVAFFGLIGIFMLGELEKIRSLLEVIIQAKKGGDAIMK